MSIAVNDLIDDAEGILQDASNIRWSAAELIDWLNGAQREVVLLKPDAYVTNASVQLAAGTKQSLPADGILLHNITRNMGTDGATPGYPVKFVQIDLLDRMIPTWHTVSSATTVVNYTYDSRNPLVYYVYPRSPGTNYVEIVYATTPPIVAAGQNISLTDVYANVLLDYVLFRAYSKDADFAGNAQLAQAHYMSFQNALVQKEQIEMPNEPKVKRD